MRPARRSIRLKGYDYSQPGAYFVTICVRHGEPLLGAISAGYVELTPFGQVVQNCWNDLPRHYPHVELDEFVIMPEHVHAILVIAALEKQNTREKHGLNEIVRALKSYSSRRINQLRGTPRVPFWQRDYYERVIRSEAEWAVIRRYIQENPVRREK
jgi:putative transposase